MPLTNNPEALQEMVHQMQVWRLKALLHEAFGTSPMPSSLLREHWLGLGLVPSLGPLQVRPYSQDQVPWSVASSAVSPGVSPVAPAVKLSNMLVKTPSE